AGGRGLRVLRQPERRLARVRAHARGAQPQRAEVSGAVLSRQAAAGTGQVGRVGRWGVRHWSASRTLAPRALSDCEALLVQQLAVHAADFHSPVPDTVNRLPAVGAITLCRV